MTTPVFVAVAWPYASGLRHLGHLAGAYLPADIGARQSPIAGNEVLFWPGHAGPLPAVLARALDKILGPTDGWLRAESVGRPIDERTSLFQKINVEANAS